MDPLTICSVTIACQSLKASISWAGKLTLTLPHNPWLPGQSRNRGYLGRRGCLTPYKACYMGAGGGREAAVDASDPAHFPTGRQEAGKKTGQPLPIGWEVASTSTSTHYYYTIHQGSRHGLQLLLVTE